MLSSPANGRVAVTGLTSGSTATYTCNTGYQLTGLQTRTCLSNGIWSGQAPTCPRMNIHMHETIYDIFFCLTILYTCLYVYHTQSCKNTKDNAEVFVLQISGILTVC